MMGGVDDGFRRGAIYRFDGLLSSGGAGPAGG